MLTEEDLDTSQTPFVLGRRSYMDDILIPATSWADLYERVNRLLRACDRWNLSISLTKRFLGTTQGGISRSSSTTCWTRRPLERSRIAGQYPVSSNAAVDAVDFGEFEILEPIH